MAWEYTAKATERQASSGGRLVPDVIRKAIRAYQPDRYIVQEILDGTGASHTPTQFSYLAEEHAPIEHMVYATAAKTSSDTDLALDTTGPIVAGKVLRVERTGEQIYCTADPSSATAVSSLTRAAGATAAAAIVAGDAIRVIGSGYRNGADFPTGIVRHTDQFTQYLAHHAAAAKWEEQVKMVQFYTGPEDRRITELTLDVFKGGIDNALLFSEPYDPTVSTPYASPYTGRLTLGGSLNYWGSIFGRFNARGYFTMELLARIIRHLKSRTGSDSFKCFVSREKLDRIGLYCRQNDVQIRQNVGVGQTEVDAMIKGFKFASGSVEFIGCPWLDDSPDTLHKMLFFDNKHVGMAQMNGEETIRRKKDILGSWNEYLLIESYVAMHTDNRRAIAVCDNAEMFVP